MRGLIGEGGEDRREQLDDLAQTQDAIESNEARQRTEDLDNPYHTCENGYHVYRVTGYDADGNPYYRCENCDSTDPEGDLTRDVEISINDVNHPDYDPTDYFEPPTVRNEVI